MYHMRKPVFSRRTHGPQRNCGSAEDRSRIGTSLTRRNVVPPSVLMAKASQKSVADVVAELKSHVVQKKQAVRSHDG